MDIEALVKKHYSDWRTAATAISVQDQMRAALTEQAETHARELREYEATVPNLNERIRQLEAERVPNEAASILANVIHELETGFVRCETCGDQEDTATLDCIDELRRVNYMLAAAPQPKESGHE